MAHLRFELGDGIAASDASARAAQAARRAAAVFEAAFAEDDEGFLSFTRWRAEDDAIFMPLLPEPARERVDRQEGSDFYGADNVGETTPCTTYTVSLQLRALSYPQLFRLIANSDLGESPSLGGRVYFVNSSRPFVFHMYDDRGARLLSPDNETLAPVRQQFGNWLVVRR